ncbi:MAG TPA: cupin domain-containing protein [Rhizomicrobium sp.]|nr:cupin domain-containing protein [Rhizomicrobium sp.]
MSDEADMLIRRLKLKPHPEGGHYRETFATMRKTRRAAPTAPRSISF